VLVTAVVAVVVEDIAEVVAVVVVDITEVVTVLERKSVV
jgi:hypothetical protein